MIKKIKLISIILITLLICGCWNYNELNTLAIASTIGIDIKDNQLHVSLMIANAKSAQMSSKEGQSQTVVLEGTGDTLTEALEEIDLRSPKKIYLNHVSSIILSEQAANKGITKFGDLLLRDPESRKKFYLFVTKDVKANDILKVLTPLEGLPSQNIASMIEGTTTYQGVANMTRYSDFVNAVMEHGNQPTITSITIVGNKKKGDTFDNLEKSNPDALLKLGSLAIFKDDKMLGFASAKESEGINLLNNQVQNMTVKIKCDDNYIVGHIDEANPNYQISLVNNKPQVTINLNGSSSINEINCKRNIMSTKVIEDIKKDIEQEVLDIINEGINAAQNKYKSDVFKIGLKFYHKYPKYFEKVEKNWDEDIFSKIKIKVNVNLKINTKGSLEQTIRKEETKYEKSS